MENCWVGQGKHIDMEVVSEIKWPGRTPLPEVVSETCLSNNRERVTSIGTFHLRKRKIKSACFVALCSLGWGSGSSPAKKPKCVMAHCY